MAINNEQTPLLSPEIVAEDRIYRTHSKDAGPDVVDFDADYDADNPQDFTRAYKWMVTLLLAFMAFSTTFTCIGVVPVANRIVRDLNPDHHDDKSASVLLVTIWELGESAGPLLIGPLSEIYGRYMVINVANVLFVAATIMAATSEGTSQFIAARALTGLVVTANVLNPAIVSDIFVPESRGSAMSLIMFAPLIGGAIGRECPEFQVLVGPLTSLAAIAGALADTWGWRSIVWLAALSMSVCTVCVILIFRETYKVVILRRRVAHLRVTTNNPDLRTPYDEGVTSLATSILRPFSVYFHSPQIILISLFGGATFTWFYIMSTTLPDILVDFYKLTSAEVGSSFITFSIGSLAAVLLCNLLLDRLYIYLRDRPLRKYEREHASQRSDGEGVPPPPKIKNYPHHRLPPIIFGSLFMPLFIGLYGLLPVGFSTDPSNPNPPAPLPATLTNVAAVGFFMLFTFLPVLPYITELASLYAASAMTSVIVVRCLLGTFLPLCVGPLVSKFGWAKAFIGLAVAAMAMGTIPIGLWVWGEYRQRMEEEEDRECVDREEAIPPCGS